MDRKTKLVKGFSDYRDCVWNKDIAKIKRKEVIEQLGLEAEFSVQTPFQLQMLVKNKQRWNLQIASVRLIFEMLISPMLAKADITLWWRYSDALVFTKTPAVEELAEHGGLKFMTQGVDDSGSHEQVLLMLMGSVSALMARIGLYDRWHDEQHPLARIIFTLCDTRFSNNLPKIGKLTDNRVHELPEEVGEIIMKARGGVR